MPAAVVTRLCKSVATTTILGVLLYWSMIACVYVYAKEIPSTILCSAQYTQDPAFSPDGHWLVCAERNGENWNLKLYETTNGTYVRTVCASKNIHLAKFSPNGRLIVCTEEDRTSESLRIYDAASGTRLRVVCRADGVYDPLFSPDSCLLVCREHHRESWSLKLYETATGTLMRTLCSAKFLYPPVFSPDGHLIACGEGAYGTSYSLKLYEAATGTCLRTVCSTRFIEPTFSPDGHLLACSESDGTSSRLKLYEARTGVCLRTLCSDKSVSTSTPVFSPGGHLIACTVKEGTSYNLNLYETATGTCIRTVCSARDLYPPVFSPDGHLLACSEADGTNWSLKLYQVESGTCVRTVCSAKNVFYPVFCSDGRLLACRNGNGTSSSLHLYQINKDEFLAKGPSANASLPATASDTPIQASVPQPSNEHKQTNLPFRDKWALIIGISKFRNPQYNLRVAAKDAKDFYNYLVNEANFSKDHVLLLLDEQATRENIMTAFGDQFLPAVSEPGDLVVVYVSTHGTPKSKDKGGRNYIVAYDTDATKLYATGVDMDELNRRINEGVKTDRALIVMDTCYSGAGIPGSRALNIADNFDANDIAQGCGHLVITSSSPSEKSWESRVTENGVFTKYLLEALRKNKTRDVKSAFSDVQKSVGWEVKSVFGEKQTPQLGGKWEGRELILSLPPTEIRPVLNPDLIRLIQPPSIKQPQKNK